MPRHRHSGIRHQFREFDLIRNLQSRFGQTPPAVLQGIGDDAAILQGRPRHQLLVTTDLLCEGIHFDRRTATFQDIGYKAAAANLSDVAAMGGIPHSLLVALAVPPTCSASDLYALYKGLMKPCQPHAVSLIGGDTSSSPRHLLITITMLGWIESGKALTRDKAQPEDLLYVSGTLGDSYAGLTLLQQFKRGNAPKPRSSDDTYLIRRHLQPEPRLTLGRFLATHQLASSAIDLSDGLSGDIRHICRNSHVGVTIHAEALPISLPCRRMAARHHTNPLHFALTGGEDYELLFTVPAGKHRRFQRLSQQLTLPLTCIGTITPHHKGIRLQHADGSSRKIPNTSFEHIAAKQPR